jgi:hypothetical protein
MCGTMLIVFVRLTLQKQLLAIFEAACCVQVGGQPLQTPHCIVCTIF